MRRAIVSVSMFFGCSLMVSCVLAQSALERLEQRFFGPSAEPPANRRVEQAYLGFRGDTNADGGVGILSVDRGGPAEAAGIRVGDVLTRFDTTQVAGLATLGRAVAAVRPGQSVPIRLRRGNATISTTLRIGGVAGSASPDLTRDPSPGATGGSLGVSIIALTDAERAIKRIPVRQGAQITAVSPGSGAASAGLKAGSVVIAFDGRRVEKPEDLIGYVNSARIGQVVELTLYEGPVLRTRQVAIGPAAPSPAPSGGLENRFGDGGRRPVLGALGRLLDDVVGDRPAPLAGPLPPPAGALPGVGGDPGLAPARGAADGLRLRPDEAALLIEQIRSLQATVERLELRIERLEGKPVEPEGLKPVDSEPLPEPPKKNGGQPPLESPAAPSTT